MSKRQKRILFFLLLTLFLALPQPVWAEETAENLLEEQLDLLPADEIYALMDELDQEMSDFWAARGCSRFGRGFCMARSS